ncbi:MAG: hypothetical protein HQK60_01820 [Deltaproteobacteria bacterium]|nr:hypothetical protein [Deltaproteobacteria bacterium]
MPINFDTAVAIVLKFEGGAKYVVDSGGPTKYGISLRFYTKEIDPKATANTIKALTEDQARAIYKSEFWDKCYCDQLPDSLALAVFDTAVNMGVAEAVKLLQTEINSWHPKGVPLAVDGIMGSATIAAAISTDTENITNSYLNRRLRLYVTLAKDKRRGIYLTGWTNRVMALKEAIKDVGVA